MKDIEKIDKNFRIETDFKKDDAKFLSALEPCFDIYGLMCTDGSFHRMPYDVAEATNGGVKELNNSTAGGRIRFKTTSKYVIIKSTTTPGTENVVRMSLIAARGFDLYLIENGKAVYNNTFVPSHSSGDQFEQIVEFCDNSERDIMIHFPISHICKDLYIGIQESAEIKPGSKYKYEKPIVFYGSSITQGACASRPGNTYQNQISRYFDVNFTNLGFSGSCLGEESMREYIPTLDMSIFVLDYDHNAPSAEHLEKTHEKLFKRFREIQPNTPVIIMSKTDIPRSPEGYNGIHKTRQIVMNTYNNAIAAGDKNVYFIDGQEIFKFAGYTDCTVDGCHPNDLGFWCMANALIKVIEENKLLG